MAKENLLNELGMGMKALVASQVALNSNFGEMSRRNGAADTQNIMTLADYLKVEKNDKLKNYNPELRDDDRLMKTYVVPLTMPNGERIDIVVNSKGLDIAQIYVNEDPENRFHLDDSVKDKIRMMTEGAIDKNANYEKEFVPKNLEELAEKISKDELIPKTQEQVKEREKKADSRAFEENEKQKEEENEKDGIEQEDDEKSFEEVAEELNVPVGAIEAFCKEQEINPNKIKGSNIIQNTEKLQRQLGTKLQAQEGSDVIALRVDGVDGTQKLAVIGMDGTTLDFNKSHVGERDEAKLLSDICPTGANGKIGQETNEALKDTLELKDDDGSKKEYEADINREGNTQYFLEKYEKIKAEMEKAKNEIENDDTLSPADKARKLADLEANEYADLENLQKETGITIPNLQKEELAEAQQAENEAELAYGVEKAKEFADDTIGTMAGIAGAVATGAVIANVAQRTGTKGVNGKEIEKKAKETEDETAGWSEQDIKRFGLGGRGERKLE